MARAMGENYNKSVASEMPVPYTAFSEEPNTTLCTYEVGKQKKKLYLQGYAISGEGEEDLANVIAHAETVGGNVNHLKTGEENKCHVFQSLLTGKAHETFASKLTEHEEAVIQYDNNEGEESARMTFMDVCSSYLHAFCDDGDEARKQSDGVKAMKKPRNITVKKWKSNFKKANDAIESLKGSVKKLEGNDYVHSYTMSHPDTWVEHFKDSDNHQANRYDETAVYHFMKKQEYKAQKAMEDNDKKQRSKRKPYKYREDNDAPGGRNNKYKNESARSKRRRLSNPCHKCKHEHEWSKCWWNPNNPNRKLVDGKVPDKFKHLLKDRASKGGNDKAKDGGHNHAIIDMDDNSDTGFVDSDDDRKPVAKKSKQSKLSVNFDENTHYDQSHTHCHHIDCLNMEDLEESTVWKTSKIPTSSSCLNQSGRLESQEQMRLSGSSSKTSTKTRPSKQLFRSLSHFPQLEAKYPEMESYIQAETICHAISMALYDEDEPIPVNDHSSEFKRNSNVNHQYNGPALASTEIRPGETTPLVIAVIKEIMGLPSKKPLRALADTGSKSTFVYRTALPAGCKTTSLEKAINTQLLDTHTTISSKVTLSDIVFPEFSTTRHVTKDVHAYVVDAEATAFDIVLGQDILVPLGIDVINSRQVCTWMGDEVPFRQVAAPTKRFQQMQQLYVNSYSIEEEDDTYCHATAEILSAKYDAADLDEVVGKQTHLNEGQQRDL